MKNKRKVLWSILAIVLVAALMVGAYTLLMPKGETGDKQITVTIVGVDGASEERVLHTNSAYLRGALEEQKLIAGDESEYGLFVKTVNGYTAQDSNQEWWCFTKGGETVMTGVDTTPIADGDHFEITLTTGY